MLSFLLLFALINLGVEGRVLWTHKEIDPHDYKNGMNPLPTNSFDHGSGSVVRDPAGGSNHVLRVFYQKGHVIRQRPNDGLQFYAKPTSHRDTMTLSYDLYFDKDFDFKIGGKLPGLYGGWTNCSGGHHSDNCFSTRFMWRTDGDGEVYGYIPDTHHQVHGFCDDKDCNSVYGYSLGRGSWRFQRGKWQNIAQTVHLNTPGKTNGYIKVWFNGKLVYTLNNVALRNKANIHIDGIFFSTFFGGHTSDWAPSRDCYTYFKNFVLSDDTTHPTIIG